MPADEKDLARTAVMGAWMIAASAMSQYATLRTDYNDNGMLPMTLAEAEAMGKLLDGMGTMNTLHGDGLDRLGATGL